MNDRDNLEEIAPWLVVLITLVGGFMRAYLIRGRGLWLDETFSVWLANQNIGEMVQSIIKIGKQPPLYYLLLHFWTGINGSSPYDARMLSVLFGAGTIPFIYLIGKRLSGVMTGLIAAVILAISPFNIRLAQDTNVYTLLGFNAAVAIYALVILLTDERSTKPIGSQFREYLSAWRTPRRAEPANGQDFRYKGESLKPTGWRGIFLRQRWVSIQIIEIDLAWVAFILFSAATLYTHNTAILLFIATNIFVLGLMLYQRTKKTGASSEFHTPSFINWLIAQICILLLWSPWISAFIQQAGRVYQEFLIPKPTWDSFIQVIQSFLNDFMPGQAIQATIFWILYAVILCLGLVAYLKKMPRFLFLAVLLVVPLIGEFIVSTSQSIFSDKTLIWTAIPLFVLLAAGIAQLRFRLAIILVVGILGTNNLFSAGDYYRFSPREDWSLAAGYVANFVEKDDLILFNSTWVQIPFDYTFTVYEEQYFYVVAKHGVPVDLFDSGIPEPRMTESDLPMLNALVSGRNRVWLVYSHNGYEDPMGLIPKTLASTMKIVREQDFSEVKVQLYEIP